LAASSNQTDHLRIGGSQRRGLGFGERPASIAWISVAIVGGSCCVAGGIPHYVAEAYRQRKYLTSAEHRDLSQGTAARIVAEAEVFTAK